jgi:hypothetical protein
MDLSASLAILMMCKYWLETSSSSNKKIWDGRLAAVAVVLSGSDGRAEVA